MLLALILVCSLCVSAFAADSPGKEESSSTTTAALPVIATEEEEEEKFEIRDSATDEVKKVLTRDQVNMIPVGEADKLSDADKEAFLAAYEDSKAVEGVVVKDFFWFDLKGENLEEGYYVRFPFSCAGENVKLFVNGKEMEVVHVKGIEYYAIRQN